MKYLTQILIKKDIKKIASNTDDIYLLNTFNDLFIGENKIKSNVFDFITLDSFLFTTDNETGNLSIYNEKGEKIIYGDFYLKSLLITKKSFVIANGYKKDGFHFNYELIDFVTFERKPFEQIFFSINDFFLNRTNVLIYAFDIDSNPLWQVDISKYGKRRLNHHGEEIDPSTPNTVSGDIMGYDDTVVVPLAGGQLLGLNIQDGSFKWILEFGGYLPVQNQNFLYTFHLDSLLEIKIIDGQILRKMEVKSFFDKIKEYPFNKCISNGKLIIDFSSSYSNLLVIDVKKFEIESYIENPYRSKMLRVGQGNCIWYNNQLYARDPLSNTLYIFGE